MSKKEKKAYVPAHSFQVALHSRGLLCISPQILVNPDGDSEEEITETLGGW